MESFAWNTCYVCHDSTVQTSDNVSQLRSMYSQLTMPVLLKMILGEELAVDWTTSGTMCFGCIAKVNDYDEAIQKAQAIQNDLVMVYRERRVDVKLECDDPISIEANSLDGTDHHIDEVEEKFGDFQSSVFDDAQDEECSMPSPSTPSHLGSDEMTTPVPSSYRNGKTLEEHSREELRHMKKHNRAKADGPPYRCVVCGLEYYTANEFDEHIELHRAAPKYQCFHCQRVSKTTKSLKEHMKSHTRKNECGICGRGCIDAQSLERHTKLHGDEINDEMSTNASVKRQSKSLSCDICHMKFTMHYKLEAHTKKHYSTKDNGPPYHCKSCGLEFYTENEFDLHLEHHRNVPNYQCLHCVFIGRNGERYRSHMRVHTKHYKCKLCCRGCIDSFALERHLATHLDIECSICEFRTKSIEEFQDHLRDEHGKLDPSLKTTDCVLCKKCFESDQALQTHLTLVHTMHESPPTQCSQCGIRLKDTDALVDHKIRHLNRAHFQCVLCDRVFPKFLQLDSHMRTHTKEKSYQCECGSRFACEPNLCSHMKRLKHLKSTVLEREVFDEATYIAQQSQKGSSSVTPSIHTSTNSNPNPKCTNCWATFGSSDALEEHTQLAKCPKRKFICKVCHQAFTARYNYLKHLKIHNLSASDTEPPFICDYCNIELQTHEDLHAHKSLHVDRPDFECVMCEFKATVHSSLKAHIQHSHVKKDPVQCDTCGKVVNSKQALTYHMKHHGEFFNECYICKWRVLSRLALTVHMRKHTGDKPYKCKYCDKRFARCENRRAHYLVHRGISSRSYKCTICDAVFPRASQRSEHYLQTHGLATDPPKHQQIEMKK